ncbi:organic solute transporter subunit alpha-like [Pollicipes pollicipes]|uniref:organic solute transporter subunit alpha-like n=1 Tax=Pollicipes pollicipes TaxID=41117 RepID=UPI0018859286|nr:organic solute transporter subunit alpha-like [Pollicipes pollicipes]XP_037072564.1 organic solute transporter subunit alpha-like [Pollicipes pollicipes]
MAVNFGSGYLNNSECPPVIKAPTTRELIDDLGGYVIALWTIASLIVLLLCGLLVKTTIIVNKDAPRQWRRKIVWINAIYPFVSLMCLCSLIVPASSSLLAAVAIIFMSNGVSKFVDLCMMYFGGETKLLEAVEEMTVPLTKPPACCCGLCCPRPILTKRYLKAMKMMVHQLPFTQSAYCLMSLYLFAAQLTQPGQIAYNDAFIYLTAVNVLSFMLAMYSLAMLLEITKGKLAQFRYTPKSFLIKVTLVLVKVQDIVFNLLVHYGGIPETPSMTPATYGAFIRDIMVLLEMLLFGLLTHKLYNVPDQYEGTMDAEDNVIGKTMMGDEND